VRLIALILNRWRPPGGGRITAETMRPHGKEVISYSLDVLRHYGETVVVTELSTPDGGIEEQVLSVLKAMSVSPAGPDFVLLHDADRPLITHQSVQEIISLLRQGREIVTASVPTRDSVWVGQNFLKEADSLQTPEGFPFGLLLRAHEWRIQVGRTFASGTELVSTWRGITPTFVPVAFSNRRIETKEDLAAVEGVLKFGQECLKEAPRDLGGLHVLILGGSGGIGQACIESLKELGATYRAPSRRELDLRHEQSYSDLGSYRAIIHTAGEYDASPEDIMQVNFFSCLNLLARAEERAWQGNIVFISSAASTWGRPGIPVYSASKSALNALVEAEANRLAAKGIIVNIVAPAKVNTRLQSIINPSLNADVMLSPRYVANIIVRYIRTNEHGRLVLLRKGLDTD